MLGGLKILSWKKSLPLLSLHFTTWSLHTWLTAIVLFFQLNLMSSYINLKFCILPNTSEINMAWIQFDRLKMARPSNFESAHQKQPFRNTPESKNLVNAWKHLWKMILEEFMFTKFTGRRFPNLLRMNVCKHNSKSFVESFKTFCNMWEQPLFRTLFQMVAFDL